MLHSAKLEASSRINNNLKWRLNAWLFENETPEDLLFFARKDDFVEMALNIISSVSFMRRSLRGASQI